MFSQTENFENDCALLFSPRASTIRKHELRLGFFASHSKHKELEKEMATHSSTLVWRILGMVEPGGLQFVGSHRVGRD